MGLNRDRGLEWLIHSFPPAPPYFNGPPKISEPL